MNYTPLAFIAAFVITNAVEFFPLHFLIKKPPESKLKALLLTNAITLPAVWLIFPFFFDIYWVGFVLIEIAVVIAETYLLGIFLREKMIKTFIVSLVMNSLSATIGLLI